MAKRAFKTVLIILSFLLLVYMFLPGPDSITDFPALPDSIKSSLEGDTIQVPNVSAYFSNNYRDFVIPYYYDSYKEGTIVPFGPLRLNYPPEEAQVIIRDQTKSTFLEEIVHPFRESFYINGYEPKEPQNIIEVGGKIWKQKVIVKFVPSNTLLRVFISLITMVLIWVVAERFVIAVRELVNPKYS